MLEGDVKTSVVSFDAVDIEQRLPVNFAGRNGANALKSVFVGFVASKIFLSVVGNREFVDAITVNIAESIPMS